MAAAMKFLLVLVALVCCMQFVEMTRMRRDEPATPTFDMKAEMEKLGNMIENNEFVKKLKDIKPEEVQSQIQEGLKTFQGNFEESKDKIQKFADDIIATIKKNLDTPKTA